ncbi:anthranilate phosphoribosyltransferase [Luteipulveratus mongoliensis]|uniref:Anthranilate phosphoribosyltransferase n=1 Tax=Luteipulveratus mongoliensis TaxID=571913 RepID=A0A0K1JKM7_9MICO|nr:anthranilate phosphoribosyltransferase [Luteipulveratus mongoliensis]AKU17148.1 anthranilate phosphoribosyltransferase [Luteipulveratus mongoliensis]
MADQQPAERTWPSVLTALLAGHDLTADDTQWVMDQVLSERAEPAQLAGFLVALRAKGETAAEMRGLADGMLGHALRIDVPGTTLDIVGTGGDQAHTVNISTMAAVVAAGSGAKVVKHGNRAASSSSGAADVLEALGVRLDLTPEQVRQVVEQAGITFCFAQTFHPSFRHAGTVRRALGIPTAFNVLGPLTNPGQPRYSATGVADGRMAPFIAEVFAGRGRDAAVFRGDDGLDELTLSTTSQVWWVRDGSVSELELDPSALGLDRAPLSALRGGDAAHNAQVAREVFAGSTGPVRDAVVLNAGMAIGLTLLDGKEGQFGGYDDLTSLVRAGIQVAQETIDRGAAAQALDRWVRASAAVAAAG